MAANSLEASRIHHGNTEYTEDFDNEIGFSFVPLGVKPFSDCIPVSVLPW
jgi:hypothetical protein